MRGRATPCARRAESREPGCVLGGFALHGVETFRASIGRADNQGEGRSRDQGRTRDADTVPTVSVMGTPEWERPPPGRAGITNAHRRWTVLAPRLEFLGPTYYMQSEKLILASRAAPKTMVAGVPAAACACVRPRAVRRGGSLSTEAGTRAAAWVGVCGGMEGAGRMRA